MSKRPWNESVYRLYLPSRSEAGLAGDKPDRRPWRLKTVSATAYADRTPPCNDPPRAIQPLLQAHARRTQEHTKSKRGNVPIVHVVFAELPLTEFVGVDVPVVVDAFPPFTSRWEVGGGWWVVGGGWWVVADATPRGRETTHSPRLYLVSGSTAVSSVVATVWTWTRRVAGRWMVRGRKRGCRRRRHRESRLALASPQKRSPSDRPTDRPTVIEQP